MKQKITLGRTKDNKKKIKKILIIIIAIILIGTDAKYGGRRNNKIR